MQSMLGLPRNRAGPLQRSKNAEYTIPIKAAFTAVLLLFLMPLTLLLAYKLNLDKETRNVISTLYVVVCNAARCPFQTAMTFSSKVRADQESKDKRQEREREWARMEMEERKKGVEGDTNGAQGTN